ncbi:unnamed protein product [Phaedon cochleariae]|uniref:FK506-binding protein n=1 Tax=Phaedon cochleariae TaxID=80249 RepID=A0A9N9X396_PHACE|nr:unnamed protein product [Phaedon cochleariae]
MFWGLIMEPQRRYTQKVKKSFHISMAALDLSTSSEEPAQVMCGFEGRNYLLCTLRKPDMLQCSLDLNFEVGDEISLAANGKCHVHLTGYLTDDLNELLEDEEEEQDEEEEESVQKEGKKSKKRNKQVKENGPPSKKTKVTSVEENEEDESEDDDDSDIDVKALLGKSLDDDEDDDSYASDEEDDDQEGEEEEDSDDSEEEEDESSLSEEDSGEEVIVGKRKSSKMNGTATIQEQASPKVEPVQKLSKKEKKKNKQQQEQQQQQNEVKTPNKESQSPKKKSLQGGVVIDELREGSGPPAKPGKFVNVYYEGRLKHNNKVFDSTNKGAGFSFRLGSGEVIKGWDVGVVGMKVGGKRRITCPPAMAYGQKGSPPTIPANSTLVFEVELKKVR